MAPPLLRSRWRGGVASRAGADRYRWAGEVGESPAWALGPGWDVRPVPPWAGERPGPGRPVGARGQRRHPFRKGPRRLSARRTETAYLSERSPTAVRGADRD